VCATTTAIIQGPPVHHQSAVELGLIDELTHLVLAEIVNRSISSTSFRGRYATISIRTSRRSKGGIRISARVWRRRSKRSRISPRVLIEVTETPSSQQTHFPRPKSADVPETRSRVSIDDSHRLFLVVGAGRHHRRRIKIDRSFITDNS